MKALVKLIKLEIYHVFPTIECPHIALQKAIKRGTLKSSTIPETASIKHPQTNFIPPTMLAINPENYDYSELTHNYTAIFYLDRLLRLFNTTQTGQAHRALGIELGVLLKNLFASLCFCTVQLAFFCYLRPVFKHLYQPRCCCVPQRARTEPLPNGMLAWLWPTVAHPASFFLLAGLDAYLFVRFVTILLLFFAAIGSLNMAVLLPVNWTGNNAKMVASGLDRFSVSNIAPARAKMLNFHFVMGILTVVAFQWILAHELKHAAEVRQKYLLSRRYSALSKARVVFFNNVPENLLENDAFKTALKGVGEIECIWPVYRFWELQKAVERAQEALDILETTEVHYLKKMARNGPIPSDLEHDIVLTDFPPNEPRMSQAAESDRRTASSALNIPIRSVLAPSLAASAGKGKLPPKTTDFAPKSKTLVPRDASNALTTKKVPNASFSKNAFRSSSRSILGPSLRLFPPLYVKLALPYIGSLGEYRAPGILRLFLLQWPQNGFKWALDALQSHHTTIEALQNDLIDGRVPRLQRLFVQFSSQKAAYTAHQCLLPQSLEGSMEASVVDIHPSDVLWENVAVSPGIGTQLAHFAVTVALIAIIVLYVLPVSFIGVIAQIPVRLLAPEPWLKWTHSLPEEIRDSLAGFLPAVLLSLLTSILLVVFRWLARKRGPVTGSALELDVQRWYFVFLLLHQFLVVSVSSSIVVVFRQVVDQPTSVPILLAANIPKAANFFFQYLALRTFAFCGSNFLQIDQLLLHLTFYRYRDTSPRKRFRRLTNLLNVQWGSIYPVYSIYASIGVVYCVLAPLMAVFLVAILALVLVYYKYALRYIYSRVNVSETHGRFYPAALLHIYTGVYCLECCLIGIFFTLRDDRGVHVMRVQGVAMVLFLILTVFVNVTLYRRYMRHFMAVPLLAPSDPVPPLAEDDPLYLERHMLYFPACFKYEKPIVWIPSDPGNVCVEEMARLAKFGAIDGASTKGAVLTKRRIGKLQISTAPPGYR